MPSSSDSPRSNSTQIRLELRGITSTSGGVSRHSIETLSGQVEEAREELEIDRKIFESEGTIPTEKNPLDAGFVDMPQRLLNEYDSDRDGSELGQLLSCASRLQEISDRVVVLGIGGSYMGARALMEACCDPYHNELSRADRGGRPKIYFEGNNVDNDHSQALIRLLNQKSDFGQEPDWSLVVISKSGGTLETAVAFRQFLAELSKACSEDAEKIAARVVPITGEEGKLASLADHLKCQERFLVPDGVGGRFSILSAVGLLPAAIMGLDVVELLRGAVEMTRRFREEPFGDNPVLDYVAACYLLESERDVDERVLSVWSKSLEASGLWYDQLLAESIGKEDRGALPLTVVNTRDLHSRAQQHQEGKRNKVMTNVVLDEWRSDPYRVGFSELDDDGLNQIGDKSLPEIMTAAFHGTNQAYHEDQRPTMNICLPRCDEYSLGQFYQMMMLATVVEGRMMGINPYGQPGVEKYKINMKRLLGMQ